MGRARYYRHKRVDMDESGSIGRILENGTQETDSGYLVGIREEIEYSAKVPYSIVMQRFRRGENSPLHFGDTLEVMLIRGMKGVVTAYGHDIPLDGSPRMVILLPNTLHSASFKQESTGTILNLKFSLKDMKRFIDFEGMLAMSGHTIDDIVASAPDFEQFYQAVLDLAAADDDFYERMRRCVRIFELFDRGIPENSAKAQIDTHSSEGLTRLIRWTEEHFREHITVDDAAQMLNLSKCYFCKYFKKQTHMTYLAYLTSVRINYAKRLLLSGVSAAECCYECGFDNVPYFIQLFKKTTGYTTREYRELYGAGTKQGAEDT